MVSSESGAGPSARLARCSRHLPSPLPAAARNQRETAELTYLARESSSGARRIRRLRGAGACQRDVSVYGPLFDTDEGGFAMAVLIRHRAAGITPAQYDEISPPLVEQVKKAPGFVLHVAFE